MGRKFLWWTSERLGMELVVRTYGSKRALRAAAARRCRTLKIEDEGCDKGMTFDARTMETYDGRLARAEVFVPVDLATPEGRAETMELLAHELSHAVDWFIEKAKMRRQLRKGCADEARATLLGALLCTGWEWCDGQKASTHDPDPTPDRLWNVDWSRPVKSRGCRRRAFKRA